MSTAKNLYKSEIVKKLQDEYKYTNLLLIPKLEKITIHRGLGEAIVNKKCVEITKYVFESISGMTPIFTKAKKSISNFKLREGEITGCKVTLRSEKMYDFLTKFVNIVLPRIRDFSGLSANSFDGRGNYNIGIDQDILFPEVDYDKIDKPRGFDITFVTTASSDKEAKYLLECFGIPFKK